MKIPLSYSIKNVFVRKMATGLAILGIALVVVVFISIMALANGFKKSISSTGEPNNILVLRKGANSEMESDIPRDILDLIKSWPEIERNAEQEPLLCSECIVVVVLPKIDGKPTNVLIRGVSRQSMLVHAKVQIENTEQNRMIEWGKQEVIIGRSLSQRLKNATSGNKLSLGKLREFNIVGVFDAKDSSFESEIWMDEVLFRDTFSRESYQSVLARLRNPSDFENLKKRIAVKGDKEPPVDPDPRLKIYEIIREPDYYQRQSEMISSVILALGIIFSVIMSAGAISGAMNTMYASIRYRRREIGTLLSLGFTPVQVWFSFILESLFLSFFGGVLGCLFALPVNGIQTGTANWQTFSESTFSFQISSTILLLALGFSLLMGFIGGFLPALSASRMNVIQALRRD